MVFLLVVSLLFTGCASVGEMQERSAKGEPSAWIGIPALIIYGAVIIVASPFVLTYQYLTHEDKVLEIRECVENKGNYYSLYPLKSDFGYSIYVLKTHETPPRSIEVGRKFEVMDNPGELIVHKIIYRIEEVDLRTVNDKVQLCDQGICEPVEE